MDSLENISILHVMLLIFLRLCIIKDPMSRTGPLKYRKVLLASTWILPMVTKLPNVFLLKDPYALYLYSSVQFHLFSTFSVFLIVLLYVMLVFTIRRKKEENRNELNSLRVSENKIDDTKTAKIISKLVSAIIVFYFPYVISRTTIYARKVSYFSENPSCERGGIPFSATVILN